MLTRKSKYEQRYCKEKSKNDTFSEIMGEERNVQVRLYEFVVCPSIVWKDTST